MKIWAQAVNFSDPGDLVEPEVCDHRLARAGAVGHVAFPPCKDALAVQLLVLQVEGQLVRGEEPAQPAIGLKDHQTGLARPRA